eukprot:gene20118-biopygen6520
MYTNTSTSGIEAADPAPSTGSAYQENKREGTSRMGRVGCGCIRRNAGTWVGGGCIRHTSRNVIWVTNLCIKRTDLQSGWRNPLMPFGMRGMPKHKLLATHVGASHLFHPPNRPGGDQARDRHIRKTGPSTGSACQENKREGTSQ